MEKKKSFTFGYSMVAFGFLGFFLTTYFDVMSPNIFVPALAEAHGFDPSAMLGAHSIGGICGALLGLYLGKLIEKKGPKKVFIVTAIISGINFGMIGVATTQTWACVHIFINQLLVLGYSMMSLLSLMARWFPRKKGVVMGFITSGSIGSGVVILPLGASLAASKGIMFSQCFVGALLVLLGIIAIFWVKDNPSDVGLEPDNQPYTAEELAAAEYAKTHPSSWTPGKVLGSPIIWILVLCAGLITVGNLGTQTSGAGILGECGLSQGTALALIGAGGIVGFIGSNFSGILDQRTNSYISSIVMYAIAVIGLLLLNFGTGMVAAVGFICQGAVVGAVNNLLPSHIITRFGPENYDAIYGICCPINRLMASLGPLIMSISLGNTGMYHMGVTIITVLSIVALVAFILSGGTKHVESPAEKAGLIKA